ncbi:hydrogenase-4 component E [bacterium BMS3Bbin12]|nr:hydrogenase-4 component E [bacterium BMS3Abin12]GBE48362.1 hydrogenase-4 component E [bacterium BMS3Bbin12]GBE50507.1 hydrogenase-4 component E [bacterium BMS3Bbin13]HDJ85488.1 formate hydrogenlyase [Chromatiales bacterium]HDK02672.1 formate hydrogenlyase [Gammaproteobacteria bacterium]
MTGLRGLDLTQQLILLLAALVLFTSFVMLAQSRLVGLVRVFAWQGVLLAVTTGLVAHVSGHAHLYISALLTLFLKGLLIPWILHRLVIRLGLERKREADANRTLVQLGGASLVIFSYYVALPAVQLSTLFTRNTIAVSLAVVLLGLLLMIVRRKAVSQVVGFMSMENGLFFAAVVATYGMPMVVELGIAFDVLVAAILFGVVFLQIRASIDSLDVDRLNRLNESEP